MNISFKKSSLASLTAVSIVAAFSVGIGIGEHLEKKESFARELKSQQAIGYQATSTIDMTSFWKVANILDEKFVATSASSSIPTNEDKVYGAIEGLAAVYGDPYTTFFPPKESKNFEDEVRGDFGGIGAEIGIKDNVLIVVAPLKGTPAERAGIKPGDAILKIDKKFTANMAVEEAVTLIRGPKGTKVTLTVKQNGETKDIEIERDTIIIPTIDTKLRDDGVFVISLYNFSANSPLLFRSALREFILSNTDKLVLDLRNNPGGYLEAATDMASFFLPVGKTIVVEDSGVKAPRKVDRSKGYNVFNENLKMVILINEGSASASEILAGALHEHGIAKLVGEKSYGKGSVQELIEITPETSLKVTVARWLTPKGKWISENGLTPDVSIEFTKDNLVEKFDPQMEKAVEILKDPNFKR
ncbi:MAG: S41 family peptidase [Minisyncoccota bacterium]